MSERNITIGVDVGGTKTAYGLFDNTGAQILQRSHNSDPALSPESFFDKIVRNINEMLVEEDISPNCVSGVGVALPSFIRASDGYVQKTTNLPKIKNIYAQKYFESVLPDYKVAVENDKHAAAIAEHRYGAGRGHGNMLYCLMSTGLASGIIIGGKLFRGSTGYAGESGHMIVTPGEGMMCGCGNRGCISAYASGAMIAEHMREWISRGERSIITELAGESEVSAKHIDTAFQMGDKLAVKAIDQMTTYCAVWLYNLYVTLDIECFVFGGGLLKMKTPILSHVKERFDAFCGDLPKPEFEITKLGSDSGVFAASCLPKLI